jgi:cyclophilin family peptidyl-prolyl cis-trans isomerase
VKYLARVVVLGLLLLGLLGGRARASEPVDDERVVLHTVAGDLVLALYPDAAPQTVAQIKKLVRAGVYDTTAFVRVEPGFLVQLSVASDRTIPMRPEQAALVHRIPAEIALRHVRGALTMAHEDGDPNSGETSFSILLGDAPHLDGKYTVFGRLESGGLVLDEMVRVPRSPQQQPVVRLTVDRAEVRSAAELAQATLAPARLVPVPPGLVPAPAPRATTSDDSTAPAWGLALICGIGVLSFFLEGKVGSAVHGSLNLLTVLVAAFFLVVVALPKGQHEPWLACILFVGLIGVFKLLGRFERAG